MSLSFSQAHPPILVCNLIQAPFPRYHTMFGWTIHLRISLMPTLKKGPPTSTNALLMIQMILRWIMLEDHHLLHLPSLQRITHPSPLHLLPLSSTLAASSDHAIRGYACGHHRCLASDMNAGAQFATSKELSDHIRTEHASDEFPDHKPYRCGLPGCKKSWKSVNGLQYHLQVSKAHFLQAITTFTSTAPPTLHGSESDTPHKQRRPTKMHPCPHVNCPQVYKQLSGLRYHLSHGHSHESPVQLDIVPPTLARKVTEKLQRQAVNA
ncbi:hypothetical protein BC834DRAFT_19612 [Gloeopeniophorella convolvens]|nr:hypothetical protein BC834DRAFT_19612 [Gloeopeniophorella convolvens]